MMDRKGGGVSDRREAKIGDFETDDFPSSSSDEANDDAGSNKLM